ncbi:MAG: hypothetical protein J6D29_01255 [Solobacterium sp.]|nr:hypothetical protein [Solobacterium sp.]
MNLAKKQNIQTLCMGILFVLLTLLLIWKAQHGFPSWDESTYLSLMYRFYLGDLPIIEEWHPTQFSALFQLPLFTLYMKLFGSNEGVFLFYRYVFIVMQFAVSLLIYFKTKRYGWISIPITVMYYLFSYNQLVSTQYTNVSFACMVSFALLLCLPGKYAKLEAYLAGIVYAFATLCTPHLVLPYVLGSIYLGILSMRKSNKHFYIRKQWKYVTLGILTIAIIYVLYLTTRAPWSMYLKYLPYVLGNQDHGGGVLQWIINTLALGKMIWMENQVTLILVPLYFIGFLLLVFDKKRMEHKSYYLWMMMVFSILLMLAYRNVKTNYAMLVYVPMGIILLLLSENYEKALANIFYIGIVYVLMINISSNTIINASRCACVVCMIPALIFLEENIQDKAMFSCFGVLLVVMIGIELYDKLEKFDVDSNDTRKDSIVLLEEGAMKGIYTTASQAENYATCINELQSIETNEKDNILILGLSTWLYLEIEEPDEYSTHTVWLKPQREEEIEYMQAYFTEFPENAPDTIWVDHDFEDYLSYFDNGETVIVEGYTEER